MCNTEFWLEDMDKIRDIVAINYVFDSNNIENELGWNEALFD